MIYFTTNHFTEFAN